MLTGPPDPPARVPARKGRREIVGAAWEIARQEELSEVTLREVARRIGMRSPSLYSHFDFKNAIYDAMFAQAWGEPAVADLARYQLMNQRP